MEIVFRINYNMGAMGFHIPGEYRNTNTTYRLGDLAGKTLRTSVFHLKHLDTVNSAAKCDHAYVRGVGKKCSTMA